MKGQPLAPGGKIRVVLCGDYPARAGEIHGGGIQSVTFHLAQALSRLDDVELHVVSSIRVPPARKVQQGNLTIHFEPRPPLPRLLTCYPYDVPRMLRTIRRIRPDIVHGQGQTRHGLAAVRSGFPHVVTPHGVLFIESKLLRTGPAGYLKSWLLDSQERDLFRRARNVILISPYLEKIYGSLLQGRVHFVENPIEEAFFHLERDPDPYRLLFVGTVVPRKQVHLLAEALARIGDEVPQARLRVVGPLVSREALNSLRDVIARHRLEEKVHMTGPVSEEQVREEYRRAGVLLLCSREETAPLVIAQAMASGVPIVSVAAGGVPFMVRHEESALLASEPNAEGLAKEILRLFREADLATRLAQEGRRQARERFLDRSVAARTLEVYRSILNESPRGRIPDDD